VEDRNEIQYWEAKGELKRAFIFWDHANVFHNLQEFKVRIDYDLAKKRLAGDYFLVVPIIYIGMPDVLLEKKKRFFDALAKTGWLITEKPLHIDQAGKRSQRGVDEVIFLHITDFAKEGAYEKAIIVSGDNIFVEVAGQLKERGIEVEVWSFRKSLSKALVWAAGREHVFFLDNVLDNIKNHFYSAILG
jgi:uncharacterized LabA/DUF88 family protein